MLLFWLQLDPTYADNMVAVFSDKHFKNVYLCVCVLIKVKVS